MDSNYTKAGYLTEPFKIFHLRDEHKLNIDFHYHDFHKILIHLHGNVSYCIEAEAMSSKNMISCLSMPARFISQY